MVGHYRVELLDADDKNVGNSDRIKRRRPDTTFVEPGYGGWALVGARMMEKVLVVSDTIYNKYPESGAG